MGLSIRILEDFFRFVVELQQREFVLKDKNSVVISSVWGLEKVRQQLQEEFWQVSGQLLEERKKCEMYEVLVWRFQKWVLLFIKEWDGMWVILGFYDSELILVEYLFQLIWCMWEVEDMVQKVYSYSVEMEVQLLQVLEELGGQK